MKTATKRELYPEFRTFLVICLYFVASAFVFSRPSEIISGLGPIFTARGLLRTDYMVLGGIGAAMLNSTLVGLYSVLLLYLSGAKPGGGTIMALWMAVGWTYWGANVLNIMPLTCGVFLYAKFKKRPFSEFITVAILSETIAPLVSLFYFSNPFGAELPLFVNILCGVSVGLLCGFLLPIIATAATRFHEGYTLYNMGVTGGMVAMFAAGLFKVFGVTVPTGSMYNGEYANTWLSGHNLQIAIFLYILSAILIGTGIFLSRGKKVNHFDNMKKIIKETGHAPNDFYALAGDSVYINMGLLCVIGTTVVLLLKSELNGATFACIFSMIAFGALGKHVYNVLPLLAGAIICAFLNTSEVYEAANILPILFSTCLAPIAGEFGWGWGMLAGFCHVFLITHIGSVTNGFNIYNNGFGSGFVAFVIVAIAKAFQKETQKV